MPRSMFTIRSPVSISSKQCNPSNWVKWHILPGQPNDTKDSTAFSKLAQLAVISSHCTTVHATNRSTPTKPSTSNDPIHNHLPNHKTDTHGGLSKKPTKSAPTTIKHRSTHTRNRRNKCRSNNDPVQGWRYFRLGSSTRRQTRTQTQTQVDLVRFIFIELIRLMHDCILPIKTLFYTFYLFVLLVLIELLIKFKRTANTKRVGGCTSWALRSNKAATTISSQLISRCRTAKPRIKWTLCCSHSGSF